MNGVTLTTAPGGLMALANGVSQPVLDAYFYSFTKAQSVARAANPDCASPAYFDAMTGALPALGWMVGAGQPYAGGTGATAQVPIAVCAEAFVHVLAGGFPGTPVNLAQIDGWIEAACAALANPPPSVAAQLDAWWGGMNVAVSARLMTVGPILEVLSTPVIPAALMSFQLTGHDWRSLVTPSTTFRLQAQPVLMTLNWRAYSQIEAALVAELQDEIRAQIRTTKLDFDTPPKAEALS